MKDSCDIQKLIDRSGLEFTPNRKKILEIISESSKALTPKTILELIPKRQGMDKVTLYRILDLFVERKILRRMSNLTGSMCYETTCHEHNPPHPHFICRECGDIECLNDIDVQHVKKNFGLKGLDQDEIELKLEGVCLQCKEK